jgi:hypothetical protein
MPNAIMVSVSKSTVTKMKAMLLIFAMVFVSMLCVAVLRAFNAEFRHSECHHAKCPYAEYNYADSCYAECRVVLPVLLQSVANVIKLFTAVSYNFPQ